MEKRHKSALAAFLFVTVLFAGCVGQSKPAAKQPMVIIRATISDPESLDPAFDYETGGGEIIENVYERLVWYDGTAVDKFIPWLAESYTVSPDGLTYTFVLRKGIKFHDGTDFNADAVVYSLQRVMKMGLDPAWIITDYVDYDSIKKIDDYTVNITTKFPYGGFISTLAYNTGSIVSPKAVEENGGIVEGQQNAWMDRNMVGTGPFKLESWQSQQQVTLVRNEEYWGGPRGEGLAKPDKVIIRNMPDENTRVLAIKAGEIDLAIVYPPKLPDVIGAPGIVVDQWGISNCINYIAFNWHADKYPMFQDKNVRAAIAHAFDYDTYINKVRLGWSVRAQGPIPFGFFGHDDNLLYYDYNMEKAKQLMAQSSYPKGFKIDMAYNSGNESRKQVALMMKDSLGQLGIDVSIKEYDFPTYLRLTRAGELPMWTVGWCADFADPDDYVQPFYVGTLAGRAGFDNPEYADLVSRAQKETDLEKRKALYFELQKKTMDDYVWIWNDSARNYTVHRDNVKGIVYNNMMGGFWYYWMYKE